MHIDQVVYFPNPYERKSISSMPKVSTILQSSFLCGGEFYVLRSNTWEVYNLGFLALVMLIDEEGPNALTNTLLVNFQVVVAVDPTFSLVDSTYDQVLGLTSLQDGINAPTCAFTIYQ
jgi:hypothetical protein